MSLIKKGRVWWLDITVDGRRIRKSTKQMDKVLAQRIHGKVLGQIAEGKWFKRLPGEDITFREVMSKYLVRHSEVNKAPKSCTRDKSLAAHLNGFFGDLTLSQITPKTISDYKAMRRGERKAPHAVDNVKKRKGAAPNTINNELRLMSHVFTLCQREWEIWETNPVRSVMKEKVNNLIERWMTYEEEEKLVSASVEWMGPILVLGIETGLRQEELLSLRWVNVDLFGRTLTILEQKNKGRDKLPLSEKAMEILKARAKVGGINKNEGLVFFNQNGNKIDARNLLRAFYSATRRAKIQSLRWHDATRHTFATRLAQSGVDLYTIQKLGRWKTIQMVMRYAHHYPESLRPGLEILDMQRRAYVTNRSQPNEKGVTACAVTP